MDLSLLHIPEEDFIAIGIRYGLYAGALFQILCLGACIFVSGSGTGDLTGVCWGSSKSGECEETGSELSSPHNTPKPHHRGRKQEKKKRR